MLGQDRLKSDFNHKPQLKRAEQIGQFKLQVLCYWLYNNKDDPNENNC